MSKNWWKRPLPAVLLAAAATLSLYLLQRFWAHRTGYFAPDYPMELLTEASDYDTILLQTGLGRPAVDALMERGEFQTILNIQERFFQPVQADCLPLLGWFTREDRLAGNGGPPLVDLQPGDIIITLSTHSLGWRHGHAGLVVDENSALECAVLGTDSVLVDTGHWNRYSNYAVLRLREVTPELQRDVAQYGLDRLQGVPYRLTAGFIGPKAPEAEDRRFGLYCSYLAWYAWNRFGFDLDSDGGRLVSCDDLLHSGLLEVVQLYGLDPRDWTGAAPAMERRSLRPSKAARTRNALAIGQKEHPHMLEAPASKPAGAS